MTLEEIEEINRLSLGMAAAVRRGVIDAEGSIPFYGYITVDLFDCPPFLMFTNNDSPVVAGILNGSFEPASMALWCALAREATGILDIGANVGVYSLCAAKLRPDLAVHAFEPNPYAFARLRIHKHVNQVANLVEHPVGVGPRAMYEQFSWNVKPGGNIASGAGFGEHRGESENIMAKVVSLDGIGIVDTLGNRPLVKIDVEGAESAVLEGGQKFLDLRPDMLIETFFDHECDIINPMLASRGYAVYGINEKARTLEPHARLMPADQGAQNFNQFVTVRPRAELERALPKDMRIVSKP